DRRSLSTVLLKGNSFVPCLGVGGSLCAHSLSVSSSSTRRFGDASDFSLDVHRLARENRSARRARSVFDNLAFSNSYDTADFCVRGLLYRLHGECSLSPPGT